MFSYAFLKSMHARETDAVYLDLLTIESPEVAESPIRLVCGSMVAVESRGETFHPFPFALTPPGDSEGGAADVSLVLNAVYDPADPITGGTIGMVNRVITGTVRLECVLESDPNVVEYGPFDWQMRESSYNAQQVTVALGYEDTLNQLVPGYLMTPSLFRGLFA
jgi:hypothetical protein